ncbi:MAG: hypothetical protein LBH59_09255 [Planctomycetaceae bacterium]|nr:hypothetical protein [Planctomycetaceae bacterium]
MKCRIVLSVLAVAVVLAVSSTVEAGMFGRLSHFRSCAPCGEVQACEPCREVVCQPCEPICEPCQPCQPCEPICEPCQPFGARHSVRPFRPISRFVSAMRERIVLRQHRFNDCAPCGEVVCSPCEVAACEPVCEPCREVVCQPCEVVCQPCEVACQPCEPSCELPCVRPGFFARLKSRLATLRPAAYHNCNPCQPVCEVEPVCEPCQPIAPCIPCVPRH